MLTLDKIYHAAFVLKDVARKTDLIEAPKLSKDCQLYLKTENLQVTGSFKVRGAYYKISQLSKEESDKGVIACSAGNHAQGVALAATRRGIRSIVCMPDGAPIMKVENTKNLGAEVCLVPGTYDDAHDKAVELQEETGMTFIHPYDDEQVIAGQGTIGVSGIYEVSPAFLAQQIDAVFTDIRPCAVKIGMVSSAPLIETIAERLRFYKAENIVVDPVMVATSGSDLIASDAVRTLCRELFPLSALITPNRHEAEVLAEMAIHSRDDMVRAAQTIAGRYGCNVLLKGGHSDTDADDLLALRNGQLLWFPGQRVDNPNTHGTGCTLSSAIAANLAKGFGLADSIARAKAYLTDALNARLDLGQGSGPLDHTLGGTGVENWMHGVPDAVQDK